VSDFISELDNLNRRIDEAIDVGNIEQLLSFLQARGELLKRMDVDNLDDEALRFLHHMVEEDKQRIARIEALARNYTDQAKRLSNGKKAMLQGYLNLQEADRVRKIDRSA